MMPHICLPVSHPPGYAREISLPEPRDGVLDGRVTQPQANRAAALRHGTDPLRGHTQLLCQRRHCGRALRWTCENGSPMRFAEQQIDSRRSEEHTSELQSRLHLVCRLLLEKKKKTKKKRPCNR